MTELHHFHPARKGSGSLCPFPIYPLYTQAEILSLDKPIADCFLFRPRKNCEKRSKRSHTNAFLTSLAQPTMTSQTPSQVSLPYFHQWVSHSKNGLGAIVYKWPTFAFTVKSEYTLAFANRIAHSGLHAETGGVSEGGGITTLGAFRTFTNIPGPGIRTASYAAFGSWSETLLKNAESLRSSDALMRVAVPKASRPRWAA